MHHSLTVKESLAALKADSAGLSTQEAKKRLAEYGNNELEKAKKRSVISLFLSQFKSMLVYILFFAVIVSFLSGETIDAVVILAILIFNALFGAYQEFKAEKAMQALQKLASPRVVVIRDGKQKIISSTHLVPGDIILLETGDRVPADARIISQTNLKVDESALTGESTPVTKTTKSAAQKAAIADQHCMLFAGTIVEYGRAKAVVTTTGMKTELGKIATMLQTIEEQETPLHKKMNEVGKTLGLVVILIAIGVFALEIFENPADFQILLTLDPELILATPEIIAFFMLAVALAVSAVPEGLPAVVTLTLAFGLQRMARRNALVRKLPAVETLGSTTIICTDKTGTLTRDEMTVTTLFANNKETKVTGAGYSTEGTFSTNPKEFRNLLQCAVNCNDAVLENHSIIGDSTEGALLVMARKANTKAYVRTDELPFDSTRKMMTTVNVGKAWVKGAPEILLAKCTHIELNGKRQALTPALRKKLLKKNDEFAARALRVLGLAYKPAKKPYESSLTFLGLVGMIDSPRPEVKGALHQCSLAGIKVTMITGDNALTAKAIGIQAGLVTEYDVVMTGAQIEEASERELQELVKRVRIFARVSPHHKLRIVEALQKNGEVVAVTGDGVNDAPALKTADIGVAMGIKGTDVAREAADMVLGDDNFASIVAAVEEGRKIFDNIRHFVKYLLAANFDEIIVVGTAALMQLPLPFLAVQILWINLVTDGFPALALGSDSAEKEIMRRSPRPREETVFHGMMKQLVIAGVVAAMATLFAFWYGLGFPTDFSMLSDAVIVHGRTMAFTTAIMFELLLVFNCRAKSNSVFGNFFSNKWLFSAVAISFLLQLAVIYVPFLQPLFGTTALHLTDWAVILPLSLLALLPGLGNFWAKE